MKEKIGLVLEGGGFRGLYTEGVLETLIDNNIELPYVIGVSMGSAVGSCYISKQKRRNYDIAMTYLDDARYLSFRNMVTQGGMFGLDFVFQDLAYELIPFDFDTFNQSDQEFVIGAMRCTTGDTDYFYKSQLSELDLLQTMRASCSLPFISKTVPYKGQVYLDGGISDSIPYKKALEDGCDKLIVVLTRCDTYVRQPFNSHKLGSVFYRDYPEVIKKMEDRHIRYHKTLDELEALEKAGKALIIRPPRPISLGRMEKDRAKIRDTYMMGYNQGKELLDTIDDFVNGPPRLERMNQLSYDQWGIEECHQIKALWDKLNLIHQRLSPDFGDRYAKTSFEDRMAPFNKMREDQFRLTCAKDGDTPIGYCISTVNDQNLGELASIYIDPSYRRMGIGDKLLEDGKQWMMDQGAKSITLGVSVGNESVIDFYEKAGFYPRLVTLEYKG